MKFSIAVAALIAACSAAAVPQKPLPEKFSLAVSFNSTLATELPDILIDEASISRLHIGNINDLYVGKLAVFHLDGDNNIMMDGYSVGADFSGYMLLYDADTPRDWRFPIQLGTFAQVDGIFAFNAGDGHGPPTTQWVACTDPNPSVYDLAWNRDDCESIEIKVVPL